MEVKRFKSKTGQRIWRVTWGKDGKFLGRAISKVWPSPKIGERRGQRLSEPQLRYQRVCDAVEKTAPNIDEKGFFWLIEDGAKMGIEVAELSLTGWKAVANWMVAALRNGWRPPKGFSVDKNIYGDTKD